MEYKLTSHWTYSKTCKDGKSRNFVRFFLNDVEILKQKIPFDENYEKGYDRNTAIYNVYLLNNKLYQTRKPNYSCGGEINEVIARQVYYPVSKKKLEHFNIPKDLKIECD